MLSGLERTSRRSSASYLNLVDLATKHLGHFANRMRDALTAAPTRQNDRLEVWPRQTNLYPCRLCPRCFVETSWISYGNRLKRLCRLLTIWMRHAALAYGATGIGSGVVEAANKVLVAQPIKRSGWRWRIRFGPAVLSFRTL